MKCNFSKLDNLRRKRLKIKKQAKINKIVINKIVLDVFELRVYEQTG